MSDKELDKAEEQRRAILKIIIKSMDGSLDGSLPGPGWYWYVHHVLPWN